MIECISSFDDGGYLSSGSNAKDITWAILAGTVSAKPRQLLKKVDETKATPLTALNPSCNIGNQAELGSG
jgi:hypothetical protein